MEKTGLFNAKGKELSISEIIAKLPFVISLNTVTRVEVIDKIGRNYVNWDKNNEVQMSFQDNGKTLKIFIYKT
jgi:hypothetical protein